MVKIAVVDDEKAFRQILRMAVRSVFSEMEEECGITEFEDGSGFLETIKGGGKFDILFTDIQMQGVDGMELGRRVRRSCPEIYIVFITSFEEYAAESYNRIWTAGSPAYSGKLSGESVRMKRNSALSETVRKQ